MLDRNAGAASENVDSLSTLGYARVQPKTLFLYIVSEEGKSRRGSLAAPCQQQKKRWVDMRFSDHADGAVWTVHAAACRLAHHSRHLSEDNLLCGQAAQSCLECTEPIFSCAHHSILIHCQLFAHQSASASAESVKIPPHIFHLNNLSQDISQLNAIPLLST